jgi:AbrB family looped-hinge helix DNA binding protein
MQSSALTVKGQITIPVEIRKQLGLQPGDKIGFFIEDDHVVLFLKENNIEAAFGICHPKTSASLDDIQKAVRKRGGNAGS